VDDVHNAFKEDHEVAARRSGRDQRVASGGGLLHPRAPKGVDQAGFQDRIRAVVIEVLVTHPSVHGEGWYQRLKPNLGPGTNIL
jgi:hypothetical protein